MVRPIKDELGTRIHAHQFRCLICLDLVLWTSLALCSLLDFLCIPHSNLTAEKSRNRPGERDHKVWPTAINLLMISSKQQDGAVVPPAHCPAGPAGPAGPELLVASGSAGGGVRGMRSLLFGTMHLRHVALSQRGIYSAQWTLQEPCLPCQMRAVFQ